MQRRSPSRREKLTPKKPANKKSTKHAIPYVFDTRGATLTENQQAWVRSLTGSLSGWRSRQKFYKNHLEAHLQAEAEAKAAEADYNAQRLAQLTAKEEQKAEMNAILHAEVEEKKAQAWAHKFREMHLAGRRARKEKYEYYGWVPEEEMYLRDLETERLMAELRTKRKAYMAKRKAAAKAEYGYSEEVYSEHTDSSDSDSDSSGNSYIVNSSSRSSSSPQSAKPVVERATTTDWRQKARVGVIRKKLSVAKGWGAVTWNQKSNIQERLLALEDDGFDIREQLDGKATSEQVTAIILERAAAKQLPDHEASKPAILVEQSASSQQSLGNLLPASLDPALTELIAELPVQVASPDSQSPLPVAVSSRSSQTPRQQSGNTGIINENTQPFSFDEPYYPQASRHLKRKRGDDTDSEMDSDIAKLSLTYKKQKMRDFAEHDFVEQALQDVKRAVLRGIFRSARSVARKPVPHSRIVFKTETSSVKPSGSKVDIPSLDYLHPRSSKPRADKSSYSISRCAMNHIMAELRFLTSTLEENNAMKIYDPDYDEDTSYVSVKPDERIKQNIRKMQRQSSHIAITKGDHGDMVFRGDAFILAELLGVLGENALLHHTRWEWDGSRLLRSNDLQWYLSPETQNTFTNIRDRYRHRSRGESDDTIVNVIENA